MMAEWRIIADFPDYQVSEDGEIVRVVPDARDHRLTGKPLKQAISKSGYAKLTLCNAGQAKNARVNRIVCAAFHGPAPSPLHHAAHNDGNRLNNCANNLRWVEGKENEQDKRLHGTAAIGDRHWSKLRPECRARGTAHGLAKLTEADVRAIRADPRQQRHIAQAYGVTQRTIWAIKIRNTWGHVA